MPDPIDDTTAAEVGHALIRWVVNDDPAGVTRFAPTLDPGGIDDARASRIGHALVGLLEQVDVA